MSDVFYKPYCESLERSVVNGFDPQDEWRPNHELKSDQHEKREISRKRNHLTVSVPIINTMRGKMGYILYWWNQWRIQWNKKRKKQENNLDKDKAWIEHRKSDQQSREKQHYIQGGQILRKKRKVSEIWTFFWFSSDLLIFFWYWFILRILSDIRSSLRFFLNSELFLIFNPQLCQWNEMRSLSLSITILY